MQSSGQLAGGVFKKKCGQGWRAPESRVQAWMKYFEGIDGRDWGFFESEVLRHAGAFGNKLVRGWKQEV
jgi:hypothetical protein